jgi:hypothetical protein
MTGQPDGAIIALQWIWLSRMRRPPSRESPAPKDFDLVRLFC